MTNSRIDDKIIRSIRTTINAFMIAALLAGLLPPPAASLLMGVADSEEPTLITEVAAMVAETVTELLPAPAIALAAGTCRLAQATVGLMRTECSSVATPTF